MSKLYYIIGNDVQIREKVYCEILKWSQAQQMDPLQPYSALEEETPNFYLYNYLGQGEKEELGQLMETYGEEMVEPIYLRTPGETEEMLLAEDIYQSYDPYQDLAKCLQEIVENVFTGYRKTAYDFAAILRLAAMQEQAAKEAEQQAAQEKEQRTNLQVQAVLRFLKKMALPAAILAAWVLIVSLITVAIFNGVNNPKETPKGNLISVTMGTKEEVEDLPAKTPTSTKNPTPTPTTAPTPIPDVETAESVVMEGWKSVFFEETLSEEVTMDIIGPVLQNGTHAYCVKYSDSNQYYFFPYTGEMVDFSTEIVEGKSGLVLADYNLWYVGDKGIEAITDVASVCAASSTGQYVFYGNAEGVFAYDRENGKTEVLWEGAVSQEDTLLASPSGDFCAHLNEDGVVTLINRENGRITILTEIFQTMEAVADNGKWVFGTVKRDETNYFARVSVDVNGITELLTQDTEAGCYITHDGAMVLFEGSDELWIFDASGTRAQLISLEGQDWEVLFPRDHAAYNPTDGIYMFDALSFSGGQSVRIGNQAIYTMEYWDEVIGCDFNLEYEDILWMAGGNYLYARSGNLYRYTEGKNNFLPSISNAKLEAMHQIVASDEEGGLLYLNQSGELYYYSLMSNGNGIYIMDFNNVYSFLATKDGMLYYFTNDGVLGVLKMMHEAEDGSPKESCQYTELQQLSFVPGRVIFEEKNNGVYFYYLSGTSSFSMPELYFLSEHQSVYLGHSNFP